MDKQKIVVILLVIAIVMSVVSVVVSVSMMGGFSSSVIPTRTVNNIFKTSNAGPDSGGTSLAIVSRGSGA